MTDGDWKRWVLYHTTMFRWNDADLAMLNAWRPLIEKRGYTESELSAASRAIVAAPPKWRGDHLHYIFDAIEKTKSAERIMAERAIEEAAAQQKQCPHCKDDGYVTVPYEKAIRDGVWLSDETAAVACLCKRGERFKARFDEAWLKRAEATKRKADRVETLAGYELRFPEWRSMVENRAAEVQELRRLVAQIENERRQRFLVELANKAPPSEPMKALVDKVVSKSLPLRPNETPF